MKFDSMEIQTKMLFMDSFGKYLMIQSLMKILLKINLLSTLN